MENNTETTALVHRLLFSWYDYMLFTVSLGLSALTGIYFGFIKKQSTANEYLLGGRRMKVFPISMSLISSTVSGIIVLSLPVDIYRFGITYWIGNVAIFIGSITSAYTYIPVFYKLQVISIYEYFQLRFNTKTRLLSSFLFSSTTLVYLPIVIYVPALALAQVTGFDIHLITLIVCATCTFYTTIGGLKAVVWSDALQFFIMIGAMVAVVITGVLQENGFENIWEKSFKGERLNINFALDITERDTILTATVGVLFLFLGHTGTNQGFIQKCIALPIYSDVRKVIILFTVGYIFILSLSILTGLIMFAKYFNCDPLASGKISRPDQLLPYYIMDIGHTIPGLPGLFIAGLFSAALSTLSAVMNATAGVIYQDFVSKFTPKNISQERVSIILKILVVIIGIISASLTYVIEYLGSILPLTFGVTSVTTGPLLGLFTVGMLVPIVNAKGAFYSGVTSLIIMAWLVFGSQWYQSQGLVQYSVLPLSTDGCSNVTTIKTLPNSTNFDDNAWKPFFIYEISFYYYYFIAVLLVLVVSVPISLMTKTEEFIVNKDCVVPFMHFLLPKERTSSPVYCSVEDALAAAQNGTDKEEIYCK